MLCQDDPGLLLSARQPGIGITPDYLLEVLARFVLQQPALFYNVIK